MRNSVVNELVKLAYSDNRIILLTGDLGFGVVEGFAKEFPERYYNVGIAEQNMMGIASGLALEGNMVFTYSIGNFPTLRCLEHIRNLICYHHANVKILSLGGGFAYGPLGMTHHATEDIAVMRALPYMRVYVPADAIEAVACLNDAYKTDGPAFIRMARGKEPNQHSDGAILNIRELIQIGTDYGGDISILTTGTILSEGILLQQNLKQAGMDVSLFSVPCIKPLDIRAITSIACKTRLIVTMEDHNVIGGLGSAVSEVIAKIPGHKASLFCSGLNETFTEVVGSQEYLRDYYGLSASKLTQKILSITNSIQ